MEGAELEEGVRVGPFARIRPKTLIRKGAKVDNFVEVKNTVNRRKR
jgi:bifunctional UDP-N-acetylglucosamine pyrophosphorylase/glucosamine-1-phosphate N-acetyltransferase